MGKTEQAEKCAYTTQSDKAALFILVVGLQTLRLWQGRLWESRFSCIAAQGTGEKIAQDRRGTKGLMCLLLTESFPWLNNRVANNLWD